MNDDVIEPGPDGTPEPTTVGAVEHVARKRKPNLERPFPRRSLEDCVRIAQVIKDMNGGKPWATGDVANALGAGTGQSNSFFYWTAAAQDFGLTEGTRNTATIGLKEPGRAIVYAASPEAEAQAKRDAFLSIDIFRRVVEHYNGAKLPESQYLTNTLTTTFELDPAVHDEFIKLFKDNAKYVGIGNEYDVNAPADKVTAIVVGAQAPRGPRDLPTDGGPICFVIMPFKERTDSYPTNFFTEVYTALIVPAVIAAGFTPKTAQRQGSDIIHATIINELLDAELVLADLTEHNPNVLFELGMRMNADRPIALIRAKGTGPIFDVDNLLRVEDYDPNLWTSTVEKDVPRLTSHVIETWENRDTAQTFMRLLRRS